jgi:regulator of replication initiation timing
MSHEYWSGSLDNVVGIVDENIKLRKENEKLSKRPKHDLSTVHGRENAVLDGLNEAVGKSVLERIKEKQHEEIERGFSLK